MIIFVLRTNSPNMALDRMTRSAGTSRPHFGHTWRAPRHSVSFALAHERKQHGERETITVA